MGERDEPRTRPLPNADRAARETMDMLTRAIWMLEAIDEEYELTGQMSRVTSALSAGIVQQTMENAMSAQQGRLAHDGMLLHQRVQMLEIALGRAYWEVSPEVRLEIDVFIQMEPEPSDARAREAMEKVQREREEMMRAKEEGSGDGNN